MTNTQRTTRRNEIRKNHDTTEYYDKGEENKKTHHEKAMEKKKYSHENRNPEEQTTKTRITTNQEPTQHLKDDHEKPKNINDTKNTTHIKHKENNRNKSSHT